MFCPITPLSENFEPSELSHNQACSLISRPAAPVRPRNGGYVVTSYQNGVTFGFWAIPYETMHYPSGQYHPYKFEQINGDAASFVACGLSLELGREVYR